MPKSEKELILGKFNFFMNKSTIVTLDPWLEPYSSVINSRKEGIYSKKRALGNSLDSFANGHEYFGLQRSDEGWIMREWAPHAEKIYLLGSFNEWKEDDQYAFAQLEHGNWELKLALEGLSHLDLYKLKMVWPGGSGERIPAWAKRVVQDEKTYIFNAQAWFPENPHVWKNQTPDFGEQAPLIYESHIGMATEEYKVGSYAEFREKVLPYIKQAGYNTIQLMAIQEHPYYGSFGYHVSNFFAASSRFGTPDELKELIDAAHGMGLKVIMDLIHSHSVKNEVEGLGRYDGSPYQFFHEGPRRNHLAWDSLCFDYGKDEVLHFLLSNLKFWIREYQFDGFRFDGVTSMLYYDHGLGSDFNSYDRYFDGGQDPDAITYLGLANELIAELGNQNISIAEEVSGYPGLASPVADGGIGFGYRMAMGIPDYWIKLIKEKADENWNVEEMFYELIRKRQDEKTIGYAESHDQALVGDKTIIFRLMDKEMYFNMNKSSQSLVIDRGIALHKMIRLITLATSGNGYLNFMGNEFGHPEWIDFPREGNNWSYHYARRQWSLVHNRELRYHFLSDFDQSMIKMEKKYKILSNPLPEIRHVNSADQVIAFERAGLLFVFNFNPVQSFPDYGLACHSGRYEVILSSDHPNFGGQGRIDEKIQYGTFPQKSFYTGYMLKVYLPSRTGIVFKRRSIKRVH